MRRLLPFLLVILPLIPGRADALTIRDVIELSRAGLGEDVLLALMEVDPSVFSIDTATLKTLKEAGVSQKVIIAMIRSGRTPPPPPPDPARFPDPEPTPAPTPAAPSPQVILIDHHDNAPAREVYVPVYVPVYPARHVRQIVPFVPPTSFSPTRFLPMTGLGPPPPLPRTDILPRRDFQGRPLPGPWTPREVTTDRPADPKRDQK